MPNGETLSEGTRVDLRGLPALAAATTASLTARRRWADAGSPCLSKARAIGSVTSLLEEGLTVIAQQKVREAHVAVAVHHGGMVVVDTIGELGSRSEVAVADVEVAHPCTNS